MTQKRVET